jgi:hypothetical protein
MEIVVSVSIPPKMFILELLLAIIVAKFKAFGLLVTIMTALAPMTSVCSSVSSLVRLRLLPILRGPLL